MAGSGLMTAVKQVERWTIEAATTGSAAAARLALTHHPLSGRCAPGSPGPDAPCR